MKQDSQIQPFSERDLDALHDFIIKVIKASYPAYYPPEAIDFFVAYSGREGILKDGAEHCVVVLREGDKIVGTGTLKNSHVKRVFVDPERQGRGYGKRIMHWLENRAVRDGWPLVELHSSLFAKRFYDHLGYVMFKMGKVIVANEERLYYQRMAKSLIRPTEDVETIDGNAFRTVVEKEIGTKIAPGAPFDYGQKEALLYAEYSKSHGVKYGESFGVLQSGQLAVVSQWEDLSGQTHSSRSVLMGFPKAALKP